ncbi:MAG: hypothetical protein U0263_17155 [Polyangiaceae bacterium]
MLGKFGVAFGFVALTSAACSSSDDGTTPAGSAGNALCIEFCDKGGELGCAPQTDDPSCVDSCTGYSGVCGTAYTAYVDCVVENGNQCLPGTEFANLDKCADEYVAARNCAACSPLPGASSCSRCIAEKCCSNFTTLIQDPSYIAYLNCVHACPDAACSNGCDQTFPAPTEASSSSLSCSLDKCLSACGGP